MKTFRVNKLGRNWLIGCMVGSCILFQLMFCGLIYLMSSMTAFMVPDWVYGSASHEVLVYFAECISETETSIARLCFFCMLSLMLHLGLICYFAMRRECSGAEQETAVDAVPEAESH